jgi:hypothetical protein
MQRDLITWHNPKCEGSLILTVGTFNLGGRLWMLAGKGELRRVHEEECIVIAIEKLHRENQLDARQRGHLHFGKAV